MAHRSQLFTLAILALLSTTDARADGPTSGHASKGGRFRALTFNIRFDFESDGPNRWAQRAALVAKVLRDSGASVITLQEDKEDQVDDLKRLLPGYEFLGRGRNANGSGEHCSIVVKSADVHVRDSGDVWLSDTPEVAGSSTWGDRYPRKFTWALLEVKSSKRPLLVLNTHMPERDDGRDPANRVKGTHLMHEWLAHRIPARERDGAPVMICGDYNSTPAEEPRATLVGADDELHLRDAFVEMHTADAHPGTVNNNFSGSQTNSRIDWVLLAGPVRVLAYTKLDQQVEGRWPSDHYAVQTDLELR